MLIWINGPFGGGKTTAATDLAERLPIYHLFDPESVGSLLRDNLPQTDSGNFQDFPAWRELVPTVARQLMDQTGQELIAVQTVLSETYWIELVAGFERQGIDVFLVLLDVSESVLRRRIETDDVEFAARPWRLNHVSEYFTARPWLLRQSDLVIDTSELTPEAVIGRLLDGLPVDTDNTI